MDKQILRYDNNNRTIRVLSIKDRLFKVEDSNDEEDNTLYIQKDKAIEMFYKKLEESNGAQS